MIQQATLIRLREVVIQIPPTNEWLIRHTILVLGVEDTLKIYGFSKDFAFGDVI